MVDIAEPTSQDEYRERFAENQYVFGYGRMTGVSLPCPFCAEAEFTRYVISDVLEVLAQEHICAACKRGAKALIERINMDNAVSTTFEWVQTSGPDQPEWMEPRLRRAI